MADLLTQNQPSYKIGDSVIYASTVGTIAEIDPASNSALVDFYFLSLWIPTILLTPPLHSLEMGQGGEE